MPSLYTELQMQSLTCYLIGACAGGAIKQTQMCSPKRLMQHQGAGVPPLHRHHHHHLHPSRYRTAGLSKHCNSALSAVLAAVTRSVTSAVILTRSTALLWSFFSLRVGPASSCGAEGSTSGSALPCEAELPSVAAARHGRCPKQTRSYLRVVGSSSGCGCHHSVLQRYGGLLAVTVHIAAHEDLSIVLGQHKALTCLAPCVQNEALVAACMWQWLQL